MRRGDELSRTFRVPSGLAMVLGIMIGSGIFRTPGTVAAQLGRPWLTFVAWGLGGVVAFAGALIFAELGTRHPRAGGKYVYAREAFGVRVAFVVGAVETAIYTVVIALLAVVAAEFVIGLARWDDSAIPIVAGGMIAGLTALNLIGVSAVRGVQNVATIVKVGALVAVAVIAFVGGSGEGGGTLADAPSGAGVVIAMATAFQAVIFTYYGYPDAAKIAEEVVDPSRVLPRILLGSVAIAVALYLLVNAAFLYVLPIESVAASKLVAADVATVVFGARGGDVIAAIAIVVVLASLNGNILVTPRMPFAMARDGLAPAVLARVNAGGTPAVATVGIGIIAIALAVTGTFGVLIGVAIALVLVIDLMTAAALIRLRMREPSAPFRSPGFPVVPIVFIVVYAALFAAAVQEPVVAIASIATLVVTGLLAMVAARR